MKHVIDLSEILRPYENKWVAISDDYKEVIASGTTLKEVMEKSNGISKSAIYTFVSSFKTGYIPSYT